MYWKDVIEEIRRNNPELERSIKDAKDTFVNRKMNVLVSNGMPNGQFN